MAIIILHIAPLEKRGKGELMIYFHTDKAREISREYVENLAKWIELFFKDLYIKKVEYKARSGRLPR